MLILIIVQKHLVITVRVVPHISLFLQDACHEILHGDRLILLLHHFYTVVCRLFQQRIVQLFDGLALFLAELLVYALVEFLYFCFYEQLVVVESQLLDVREGGAQHVGLVETQNIE